MDKPSKKPMNATALNKELANRAGCTAADAKKVIEALKEVIITNLSDKETQQFVLHGITKFKTVYKPAVAERKGINPFTKEETTFKARPAKIQVKAQVLKSLKQLPL